MISEFLDENLEVLIIVYSANVSADVSADVWYKRKLVKTLYVKILKTSKLREENLSKRRTSR